jgi:hypothetical protein
MRTPCPSNRQSPQSGAHMTPERSREADGDQSAARPDDPPGPVEGDPRPDAPAPPDDRDQQELFPSLLPLISGLPPIG